MLLKSNLHALFILSKFEGTSVDWEVSLQLSSTGPSNILPPGWYFMQMEDAVTLRNLTSLYGNVPINNLNEWSLDKLGWYKTSKRRRLYRQMEKKYSPSAEDNDQVVAHTFSQVKRALNVEVQNCAGNAHSYEVKFELNFHNQCLFLEFYIYIPLVCTYQYI